MGTTGKMEEEISENGSTKERMEVKEPSEPECTADKVSELDRTEEKKWEDNETGDMETADEGLPPSKESGEDSEEEDEEEEESDGQKELPDDNNNSLEISMENRENFVEIPELPLQVGGVEADVNVCHFWRCF